MTPKEIKSLREKLGLTQQAFSELMNVSFVTVNRWENGVSRPGKLAINRMDNLTEGGIARTFTLRGKTYSLTKKDVEHRLESIEPRPAEKYSVMIEGRLFPPKQAVSEALDIPVLDFTTMDATRILAKIGFKVTQNGEADPPAPAGDTKVRNGTGRTGTIIAGPICDTKGREWMVVLWDDDDDGNPELHLATDLWRPYK